MSIRGFLDSFIIFEQMFCFGLPARDRENVYVRIYEIDGTYDGIVYTILIYYNWNYILRESYRSTEPNRVTGSMA